MSVSVAYVQMMAAYNAEVNRRLYAAAARLDDTARRAPRGAFWGSIHGTFAHLLWADRAWMGRFAAWPGNAAPLKDSATDPRPFEALHTERQDIDRRIQDWAATLPPAWLDGDYTWFSGAAQQTLSKPYAILVPHFFNHQTHHRGQLHAMLTAAGQQTDDVDLMLLV